MNWYHTVWWWWWWGVSQRSSPENSVVLLAHVSSLVGLSAALGNSCEQPVVRSGNPEFTWNHPWRSGAARRQEAPKRRTESRRRNQNKLHQFEPEVAKLLDCWATKRLPGCGSHISTNSSIKIDSRSGKGWFATMMLTSISVKTVLKTHQL